MRAEPTRSRSRDGANDMSDALQVKGFAWLNLLRFVEETHGRSAATELASGFPQHRVHFDTASVLPIGWVPGALHLGAIDWVVKRFYEGTSEGARRFGKNLAARNVSSTFTSFARLEDLKVALTSTERAFSQFYSRGTMKFTLTNDLLEARLTQFPDAFPIFGNVLGAGLISFLHAGHVEATLLDVQTTNDTIVYRVKLVLPSSSRASPLPLSK
ncbi:MAG: hypothetical protein QM817_02625 [Archangium sp.]